MKKQIISKPLRPNAGIMSWYIKSLQKLCLQMTKECTKRLSRIYGDLSYQIEMRTSDGVVNPVLRRSIAEYTIDESISSQTRIALNELSKKYSDKFSKESKNLIKQFLKKVNKFATLQFFSSLKDMLGENARSFTLPGSAISPEKEEILKALLFESRKCEPSVNSKEENKHCKIFIFPKRQAAKG